MRISDWSSDVCSSDLGYVLKDSSGAPELVLIATGSEVDLAMQAAAQLGDKVRVVSMPSTDVFDRQPAQYRESVLPNACRRRVAIEIGRASCRESVCQYV